ncbi:hypothetical protein PHYSODRAFT_253445 [Phytophthora sojae]|uniref:Uncharacterized protein n=1 Tax=Phytophthora sojae (strain P6497) TaxID=1094619 RepID=G4Z4A2_PHYSP|nr:hypothetical protein PHYSODRAFT_253445 [Phytophthora sojae]EGZ19408.1 hypothetical protein PHYSODRAFT_253445 [Phytophthora sojae]|eukprot:XP_009522125.1 hypothetical protein PHYSODRAFT_253445 [Phytophthora sojae]
MDEETATSSVLSRCFEWQGPSLKYQGRYSIDKLLAFEDYQRVVSPLRVLGVLVLTPVPSLIVVVLLAAIPLESPLLSVEENKLIIGSRLRHYHQQMIRIEYALLVVFHILAVVFIKAPSSVQAGLTAAFPVLFAMNKRMVWCVSHPLQDMSTDVTLCVVVIFGSLLRMICLQSVHSLESTDARRLELP